MQRGTLTRLGDIHDLRQGKGPVFVNVAAETVAAVSKKGFSSADGA